MFVYVYPFPFFTYPFCNLKVMFNFFYTRQKTNTPACWLKDLRSPVFVWR